MVHYSWKAVAVENGFLRSRGRAEFLQCMNASQDEWVHHSAQAVNLMVDGELLVPGVRQARHQLEAEEHRRRTTEWQKRIDAGFYDSFNEPAPEAPVPPEFVPVTDAGPGF